MSVAGVLFCVLFALSVDTKPMVEEPACGYENCPLADPDALNVHLIAHSHDDVGWQKTVDQYFFEDVENVISSVVDALSDNMDRRYVQVETAFFKMWWERQNDVVKQKLADLVNDGQFEIINGAWSMNDEAAVHYHSTIDQFTLGLRFLEDNLGKCARPRVGWQIDPFGHSREQASISAHLGFDSMFFARLDYRDKNERLGRKAMDLLWRGSSNLGNSSDLFTSVLYNHYSAPGGFCFDIVCDDDPIIDDEESPDYNYEQRVQDFADVVRDQAPHYPTNNILIPMGDDFRYEAGITTFTNLDRLVKGFDLFEQTYQNRRIKVFYSTPSCYAKAVNDYVIANDYNLEIKTDDFFPYADGPTTYWTGFFTSRPASKHFERQGSNLVQVAKQLAAGAQESYYNEQINSLKEALGIMQHHDAITGTEKQHVTDNYHLRLARGIVNANDAAGSILSTLISGNADDDFAFDSCILANVSSCSQTNADSFTVVVYNPLSRVVSTIVNLPVYSDSQWQILDPDDNTVDYQIDVSLRDFSYVDGEDTSQQTLVFPANDILPLGYKVFRVEATDAKVKAVQQPSPRAIGYDETSFEIDDATGLLTSVTMNGITLGVTQDFQYYQSEDSSGAYIFVPRGEDTIRIAADHVTTTVVSGDVSQGVLQEFGSWARQFIKIYNNDKTHIEFDWVIGPIDIGDHIGKEVVSKFTTSLATEGFFYTDSNGRETLRRVRNFRPDYQYTDEEPIAGNYYPINAKISIRDADQDLELAVLTDRSEGGSSIHDGEVEIMVHRACQSDDGRGVGENLNEQQYGQGIVVRGKHFLLVGPKAGDGTRSLAAIQRDIAQRKSMGAWTFVTNKDVSGSLKNLEFSALNGPLSDNVQILTLEPWGDNTVLLRLEHVLEQSEDSRLSQSITVDVADLFSQFTITELQETTLGGNMLLEESTRLHWPGSRDTRDVNNKSSRDVSDLTVDLSPMQIRTFWAKVTYN